MGTAQSLAKILTQNYSAFLVGSLPFQDPEQAVRFILERPYLLPCWPELPQRSSSELMLNRTERACSPSWSGYSSDEASGFFELITQLSRAQHRLPILKLQVMGPVSQALQILNRSGSVQPPELEHCAETCLKQVRWQIEQLARFADSVLVVVDDPGFYLWHEFDSEFRQAVIGVYSYLYVCLHDMGTWFGLHSCAGLHPDLLSLPLDLWSFAWSASNRDQHGTSAFYSNLSDALKRGTVLIPGVYPCTCKLDCGTESHNAKKRFDDLCEVVGDRSSSELSALLPSAECGFANSEVAWVEYLYPRANNEI